MAKIRRSSSVRDTFASNINRVLIVDALFSELHNFHTPAIPSLRLLRGF